MKNKRRSAIILGIVLLRDRKSVVLLSAVNRLILPYNLIIDLNAPLGGK